MINKTSFHSHTEYCNHAKGNSQEVVGWAYENKFTHFAITEHVAYQGRAYSARRTSMKDQKALIQEVKELKTEYKGRMSLMMGFECEWLFDYKEYYKELIKDPDVDMLIIGNHYENVLEREVYYPYICQDDDELLKYTNQLVEAINSGLFIVVAHPGFAWMNRTTWNELDQECARRIIQAAIDNEVLLGLNINGLKKGKFKPPGGAEKYRYPSLHFFQMAGKMGAEVIIELDSHDKSIIYDNDVWVMAEELVELFELKRVMIPDFKKYWKKNGVVKKII